MAAAKNASVPAPAPNTFVMTDCRAKPSALLVRLPAMMTSAAAESERVTPADRFIALAEPQAVFLGSPVSSGSSAIAQVPAYVHATRAFIKGLAVVHARRPRS